MTPATALARVSTVNISSDLLGTLTVPADDLLTFPAGLFGFPGCTSFVLLPASRDGMYWLQCADASALAFMLVDPFVFFDGYSVDLSLADRGDLRATDARDVAIFAIVTLPRERSGSPTANLQGPIAINFATRRAKQLAIADSDFGTRATLAISAGA